MAHAILICDDDPDIRRAMRRAMPGYDRTETGAPREAREALMLRPVDAVVSNFSLEADSDGLDLLQHVRMQYPDTVRFLETGNRDIAIAADALNEGAVQLSKPWNDEKLRAALEIVLRVRPSPVPSGG